MKYSLSSNSVNRAIVIKKRLSLLQQPLSPLDQPPIHSDYPNELLITESDVFRYLASIDCSKATGPDLISGTMLKNTATAITCYSIVQPVN